MNDFNGIWLAAPILELPDLNLTEKVILSQVIALSREGECNAQNDYIASKTRLTTTTTSTTLGRLEDKGYLEIDAGKQQGNKRTLWPSLKSLHTLFKNLKEGDTSSLKIFKTLYKNFKEVCATPLKETERPYLKILHKLFKNFKELIYRIDNKTDNKEDNKPSKEYKAVANRADAPFWSIVIKAVPLYLDRKAYRAFVKKNTPPCAAPPLAENQFAYEYEAGKTEVLQWPDSFSPAMRAFFLDEWLPYHRKRGGKRLTVQGIKLQLADLNGLPDTTFFDTLNKAIKSNWQSFHVKQPSSHHANHSGKNSTSGRFNNPESVRQFGEELDSIINQRYGLGPSAGVTDVSYDVVA